ncbi:hypothetical protein O181_053182, partial [Austropuccinia psidii MF-1]|nr:hypothetical protein [Austropuccinia psidii MF-1]
FLRSSLLLIRRLTPSHPILGQSHSNLHKSHPIQLIMLNRRAAETPYDRVDRINLQTAISLSKDHPINPSFIIPNSQSDDDILKPSKNRSNPSHSSPIQTISTLKSREPGWSKNNINLQSSSISNSSNNILINNLTSSPIIQFNSNQSKSNLNQNLIAPIQNHQDPLQSHLGHQSSANQPIPSEIHPHSSSSNQLPSTLLNNIIQPDSISNQSNSNSNSNQSCIIQVDPNLLIIQENHQVLQKNPSEKIHHQIQSDIDLIHTRKPSKRIRKQSKIGKESIKSLEALLNLSQSDQHQIPPLKIPSTSHHHHENTPKLPSLPSSPHRPSPQVILEIDSSPLSSPAEISPDEFNLKPSKKKTQSKPKKITNNQQKKTKKKSNPISNIPSHQILSSSQDQSIQILSENLPQFSHQIHPPSPHPSNTNLLNQELIKPKKSRGRPRKSTDHQSFPHSIAQPSTSNISESPQTSPSKQQPQNDQISPIQTKPNLQCQSHRTDINSTKQPSPVNCQSKLTLKPSIHKSNQKIEIHKTNAKKKKDLSLKEILEMTTQKPKRQIRVGLPREDKYRLHLKINPNPPVQKRVKKKLKKRRGEYDSGEDDPTTKDNQTNSEDEIEKSEQAEEEFNVDDPEVD